MNTIFKPDFSESDFKNIKLAIRKFCLSRKFESMHTKPGWFAFDGLQSYNQISDYLGLAYTSSSSYAGLWACNTELYLDLSRKFKLDGFVAGVDGFFYAVFSDVNEDELIIRIN